MWDKLKSLVMEDDCAAPAATPAPKIRPATTSVQPPVQGAPIVYGAGAPALNQGFVDAIRKATFTRNTALTNLIQQSENFIGIIDDPVVRIKAAHKASGSRSAKDITDAVAIHLSDVDGEESRFATALNAKIKNDVGSLTMRGDAQERQLELMNSEIATMQERIVKLQANIVDGANALNQLRHDASQKEAELRTAEAEFKVAADHVRAELNGHKTTITSTLA